MQTEGTRLHLLAIHSARPSQDEGRGLREVLALGHRPLLTGRSGAPGDPAELEAGADYLLQCHRAVMMKMLAGLADTPSQIILVGLGSFRPASERLIGKLLDMAGLHGNGADDGTRINLTVRQSTLAALIGVGRENVNRALTALTAQRLIGIQIEGQLTILDPAQLWHRRGPGRAREYVPGSRYNASATPRTRQSALSHLRRNTAASHTESAL